MNAGFDEVHQKMDTGFAAVDQRFESVEKEIREMRKEFSEELRQLRHDVENIKGFSKEIDTILSRVAVLEDKFQKYIAGDK